MTGRLEVRIGDPRKEEQNPSLSPPKARVPDEERRDEKREEEETDEEDRVANSQKDEDGDSKTHEEEGDENAENWGWDEIAFEATSVADGIGEVVHSCNALHAFVEIRPRQESENRKLRK